MQFVPGEGPQPCDLFLCGEGPGAEEDKYGRPWVGKAGRELWRYLWHSCQRTRTSVYATNLVKFRVPEDGDPAPDDIARDASILAGEVVAVRPEVIVTLGRWATRNWLGDVDLEVVHGIPHLVEICTACGQVFASGIAENPSGARMLAVGGQYQREQSPVPLGKQATSSSPQVSVRTSYRPGARRLSPRPQGVSKPIMCESMAFRTSDSINKYTEVERHTDALRARPQIGRGQHVCAARDGKTRARVPDMRAAQGPGMEGCCRVPQRVATALVPVIHPAAGLHSTEFQGAIAWDFEQLGKLLRGDKVQWAAEDEIPDTVYYESDIRGSLDDVAAVDTEGSVTKPWCLSWASMPGRAGCIRKGSSKFQHIILHNALHDIGVLRSMKAEYESFDDTMIMAYLLCVEPQGLKALAKRHCGMEMQDYSELVAKPNRFHAHEYLNQVIEWLNKRSNKGSHASVKTPSPSRKRTSAKGGRKSSRTASRAKSSKR